jgi:hypothetical protein
MVLQLGIRLVVGLGFVFSLTMWLLSMDQIAIASTGSGLEGHIVRCAPLSPARSAPDRHCRNYVPMWDAWDACEADPQCEQQQLVNAWMSRHRRPDIEGMSAPLMAPPLPSRQNFLYINVYGALVHLLYWPTALSVARTPPQQFTYTDRIKAVGTVLPVVLGYVWGIHTSVGWSDFFWMRTGAAGMEWFRLSFSLIQLLALVVYSRIVPSKVDASSKLK